MTDLSATIAPKSDQLNADDLIAGPRTVVVTRVTSGSTEQPIAIHYEGDDGKPYYPCKSMRRLMVALWGPNGNAYPGRGLTLYRDPKVKWGGIEVGGIRISHMTHIDGDQVMSLTESKSKRAPHRVRKLELSRDRPAQQSQQQEPEPVSEDTITSTIARLEIAGDLAALSELWEAVKLAAAGWPPEAKRRVASAEKARREALGRER